MDHSEIERDHVIERYLQDRLAGEQATAFEAHLLECDECFDAVHWADDLGRALRVAAAEDVTRLTVGSGLMAFLSSLGRSGQLSLLALLAVVVVTPALLLRSAPDSAPRGNTPFYILGAERDVSLPGQAATPSQQIRPSSASGGVVLALELDAVASPDGFQAALTSLAAPGDVIWQGDGLLLDYNAMLTVSFPAGFLDPGDYQLQVTEGDSSEQLARFTFRVLAAES